MIDLSQFKNRTPGTWVVRKKVDDSGDYLISTYDVYAHFNWGDQGICYEIANPNDAALFASAPELISEIEALRFMIYDLRQAIDSARSALIPGENAVSPPP